MFDFIFGIGGALVGLAALVLALLGWGAKKKHEGRTAELERARVARDKAARDAAQTRDAAAAKPIDQQRRDVERWER